MNDMLPTCYPNGVVCVDDVWLVMFIPYGEICHVIHFIATHV